MRQRNLSSKKIAEQKTFSLVKTVSKFPYTLGYMSLAESWPLNSPQDSE